MLAICTASVAALPSSVTKYCSGDTVTLELVGSSSYSKVSCYKGSSSGFVRLDSFYTQYQSLDGKGPVYSDYKSGQMHMHLVSEDVYKRQVQAIVDTAAQMF